MQLVRALVLRFKTSGASPLTPLQISGEENYMKDIPSRSFGSNPYWFCKDDTDLLNLFNKHFRFPNQASWAIISPSSAVSMKVISVLRMKHFEMGECLKLKNSVKHVENFGVTSSELLALATGCHMPAASSMPHRIRKLRTLGPLWLRQTSCNWHILWDALSHWQDGLFVL